MEAPERIYFSAQQQWTNPFIGLIQKCADTDIEYTRTDAFIEKAQSFFRQSHHLYALDGIELQHFIDDFRKVMKGE